MVLRMISIIDMRIDEEVVLWSQNTHLLEDNFGLNTPYIGILFYVIEGIAI